MSEIRLYKKFYRSYFSGGTRVYSLIDPSSLTASTFVAGVLDEESSTVIESDISTFQENTGIYYANLNANLYASDVTYDLVWFINYTSIAPTKKISTRFRLNVNKITNQIEVELINNYLEIEILPNNIDIDIF